MAYKECRVQEWMVVMLRRVEPESSHIFDFRPKNGPHAYGAVEKTRNAPHEQVPQAG